MTPSDNMIGVQLTYLALDCFHSIGIEALLAFATELLEVHLKKKASSVSIERLIQSVLCKYPNLCQNT